jgi:hypothetical protein
MHMLKLHFKSKLFEFLILLHKHIILLIKLRFVNEETNQLTRDRLK